jgi:hypothetical protein
MAPPHESNENWSAFLMPAIVDAHYVPLFRFCKPTNAVAHKSWQPPEIDGLKQR